MKNNFSKGKNYPEKWKRIVQNREIRKTLECFQRNQ